MAAYSGCGERDGVVASIGCSFSGVGFLLQNHYPRGTGALSGLFRTPLHALLRWIGAKNSINVEGAFWHIMADLMSYAVVVVSGTIVLLFDWDLVDPVLSILIAALILVSSCRLAVKVFHVLLESTPAHLDMYRLCSALEDVEGVTLVHDVPARTITTGYEALTAHVLVAPDYAGELGPLLRRLRQIAYQNFGLRHITIQVEQSVTDCIENRHVGHLAAKSSTET